MLVEISLFQKNFHEGHSGIHGAKQSEKTKDSRSSPDEDSGLSRGKKLIPDAAPADLSAEQGHQGVPQGQERRYCCKEGPGPAFCQELGPPIRKDFHDRRKA
jgi:hypothetical protein